VDSLKSRFKKNVLIGKYFLDEYLDELDNAGIILRTVQGVYVCFVKSPGRLEILPYSGFLARKAHKFIKIRLRDKLIVDYKEDKGKSVAFFEKIKRYVDA
jgi:hypothetical protein